jgi:dTDP-L-rhamnose 4-epimerase
MADGLVLVTGGAGFIGSYVVDALLDAGRAVRVVDNLHPAAHAGRPGYLNPGAEFVEGDLRDPAVARAAVDGVAAVSHQAAMVGLGVDLADLPDYVSHNDLGTAELLRALHARGFDGRIVLASSMVVYGEGRYACADHGIVPAPPRAPADLDAGHFEPACPVCGGPLRPESVPEDAPLDPRNVYAATKLHQEHLLSAFARETGASPAMLRYHNVYGPRMPRDTPYAGVASIFRSRLAAGAAPLVTEDGGQLRDFVHVRDVARANLLALDGAATGPFNVASGTPRSVGEMARALWRATGADQALEPQVTGAWRGGDVRHVFASTARITGELAYAPAEAFDAGMAEFATAELRASTCR